MSTDIARQAVSSFKRMHELSTQIVAEHKARCEALADCIRYLEEGIASEERAKQKNKSSKSEGSSLLFGP